VSFVSFGNFDGGAGAREEARKGGDSVGGSIEQDRSGEIQIGQRIL